MLYSVCEKQLKQIEICTNFNQTKESFDNHFSHSSLLFVKKILWKILESWANTREVFQIGHKSFFFIIIY